MPETIYIDIWGQIQGESDNYRVEPPCVVEVDAPDGTDGDVFRRFFNETPCAFHRDRITKAGGRSAIVTMVAYGDWEDRQNANFLPIDAQPIPVPRQEIIYSGGTQTVSASAGVPFSQTLASAGLYYGSGGASYVPGSFYSSQAVITSSGTIEGTFTSAGTYTCAAFLTAPLAKPVPVSIVITVN